MLGERALNNGGLLRALKPPALRGPEMFGRSIGSLLCSGDIQIKHQVKSQLAGPGELIAPCSPLKPIFGKPKMLKQRGHS